MNFDPKDLEALAAVLIQQGAPILGGLLGGPAGAAVAGAVIPEIAKTLGLPADATPQAITVAAGDPDAADKLAAFDAKHKADQEYNDQQIKASLDLAAIAKDSLWETLFVVGYRPAAAWIAGPITLLYQGVASAIGHGAIPSELYWTNLGLFASLAGVRMVEMVKGVATKGIR